MWHTTPTGSCVKSPRTPTRFHPGRWLRPGPWRRRRAPQALAAALAKLRFFDKPDDLLRQPLDGVVVEGASSRTWRLARRALESGRPVLLEKPAGTDFDDFRRLIDLAQRRHLHVQMLYRSVHGGGAGTAAARPQAEFAASTSSAPGCEGTGSYRRFVENWRVPWWDCSSRWPPRH